MIQTQMSTFYIYPNKIDLTEKNLEDKIALIKSSTKLTDVSDVQFYGSVVVEKRPLEESVIIFENALSLLLPTEEILENVQKILDPILIPFSLLLWHDFQFSEVVFFEKSNSNENILFQRLIWSDIPKSPVIDSTFLFDTHYLAFEKNLPLLAAKYLQHLELSPIIRTYLQVVCSQSIFQIKILLLWIVFEQLLVKKITSNESKIELSPFLERCSELGFSFSKEDKKTLETIHQLRNTILHKSLNIQQLRKVLAEVGGRSDVSNQDVIDTMQGFQSIFERTLYFVLGFVPDCLEFISRPWNLQIVNWKENLKPIVNPPETFKLTPKHNMQVISEEELISQWKEKPDPEKLSIIKESQMSFLNEFLVLAQRKNDLRPLLHHFLSIKGEIWKYISNPCSGDLTTPNTKGTIIPIEFTFIDHFSGSFRILEKYSYELGSKRDWSCTCKKIPFKIAFPFHITKMTILFASGTAPKDWISGNFVTFSVDITTVQE